MEDINNDASRIKKLKNNCLWLDSARKFYMGLYRAFGDPFHKKEYYRFLHLHITGRGK
ncbi:MAG: hypothetical protein M3512_17405 [Bacteroidota bacterium]|nr:hypothetical protein [Bacteroidota bacterium]